MVKKKKIGDTETEKYKFYQYKIPISINDININPIHHSLFWFL